jgi:hypothetical protein
MASPASQRRPEMRLGYSNQVVNKGHLRCRRGHGAFSAHALT